MKSNIENGPKTARRYEFDWLRVMGVGVVFLFHCGQPFNPGDSWHVVNAERSSLIGWMATFFNIWIMPLFMCIAGMSSVLALSQGGIKRYLRDRLVRIFFPLAIGIVLFVAPQVYWERLYRDQFAGSFWQFFPQFFSGVYPEGNFSWHHLWFLAYVFAYGLIGIATAALLMRWKTRLASIACHMERRPALLLLPFVPLAAGHLLLQPHFPKTHALWNDWYWHSQLFGIFVLGQILVSHSDFYRSVQRARATTACSATLATALYLVLVGSDLQGGLRELTLVSLYRFATWAWVLAAIGLAARYLTRPSRLLARLSRASYPVYIIHQAAIVGLASVVCTWSFSISGKFLVLVLLSALSTWLIFVAMSINAPGRRLLGLK